MFLTLVSLCSDFFSSSAAYESSLNCERCKDEREGEKGKAEGTFPTPAHDFLLFLFASKSHNT